MSAMWPISVSMPVRGDDQLAAAAGDRRCSCRPCRSGRRAGRPRPATGVGRLADRQALPGERGLLDLEGGGHDRSGRRPGPGCRPRPARRRRARARSASISTAWPSRRTRAIVFIICASALTLSSAFASWRRPITALKTVRPASTTVVPVSPVTSWLTTAATSSTICMKSWYWRRNAWKPDSFFAAASRFGPVVPSRERASSALRPRPGSTASSRATEVASSEYQSTRAPVAVLVEAAIESPLASQRTRVGRIVRPRVQLRQVAGSTTR